MHDTTLRLGVYGVLMAGLIAFGICQDAHAEGPYTSDDTHAAIHESAAEIGVDEGYLNRIVSCETGGTFDPYAVGDHGTSFGAVQLHRGGGALARFYSWQYTDPFDPYQAVRFLAQEVSFGRARQWSCA